MTSVQPVNMGTTLPDRGCVADNNKVVRRWWIVVYEDTPIASEGGIETMALRDEEELYDFGRRLKELATHTWSSEMLGFETLPLFMLAAITEPRRVARVLEGCSKNFACPTVKLAPTFS